MDGAPGGFWVVVDGEAVTPRSPLARDRGHPPGVPAVRNLDSLPSLAWCRGANNWQLGAAE